MTALYTICPQLPRVRKMLGEGVGKVVGKEVGDTRSLVVDFNVSTKLSESPSEITPDIFLADPTRVYCLRLQFADPT